MRSNRDHIFDQLRSRRLLCFLLVVLLAFSVLGMTACGGADTAADSSDQPAAAGSEAQAGADPESADPEGSESADREGDEGASEGADRSGSAGDAQSGNEVRSFTDDCGRAVTIPEHPTKVVSSGPLAQIIIYAIAPDTLMAMPGKWSELARLYVPEQYQDLPEIGSFFGSHDLNYEEIARLGPELVIDVGEDKPSMKSDLADITSKTGIPAVHISADYDDMDEVFLKLGELFGREKEGKALSDYCASVYQDIGKTMDQVKKKKTVMYCTQEDGLNVLAENSYHSQIVDLLGDNVAELSDPSSQGSGNEVNLEQMMLWDPEVIIFAPDSYYEYVADDPSWAYLTAVKNGTYYEVPSGPYNWMGSPPSSNRILGMLWMAKLLYPKQADFDLKAKTIEYYRLFYHYDLSEQQYEALVSRSIGRQ